MYKYLIEKKILVIMWINLDYYKIPKILISKFVFDFILTCIVTEVHKNFEF